VLAAIPLGARIAALAPAAAVVHGRRALAMALLGSVALHLSALLGFRGPPEGESVASQSPVLTVRMIAAPALAVQPPPNDARPVQDSAPMPAPAPRELPQPSQPPRLATAPVPSAVVGPALPAEPAASPVPTVATAAAAPVPPAQPAPASLPAAPAYRGSAGLDVPPQPLNDIQPEYPATAGQQVGRVVLRVLIDEQGHVDNVAVVRAFPRGYFEAAAIEAFAKAQFSPGTSLGAPVKSQMMVEVDFTPFNRGATVSGRGY
jgi:protein TonB